MEGMVQKRGEEQVSLCDLGYCHIGLDDNWQQVLKFANEQCTYHDNNGYPIVNTERFPNLKQMTEYGHKLGLTMGWYFNNCHGCHEKCPASLETMKDSMYPFISRVIRKPKDWNPRIHLGARQGAANERCYEGDVKALFDYGFDGVKLDACGWQMDLDLWHKLMMEEYQSRPSMKKPMLIEACHWGETKPEKPKYVVKENGKLEDTAWCPFHFWRTSGDIWASYGSFMAILQYTFANYEGLSRPGCWAHMDMLEVGCANGPNGIHDEGLTYEETRTHFAAWAIMSSPLFLSNDVTNETIMDQVWPIISNTEIIAINQAWAGFSGGPFWKSEETIPFRFQGVPNFTPDIHRELYLYKPLEQTVEYSSTSKEGGYTRVAVLMINSGPDPTNLTLDLNTIPGLECASTVNNSTVACEIRNVWKQESIGIHREDTLVFENVASHDSVFLVIGEPVPPKDRTSLAEFLEFIQINEGQILSLDTMSIWGIIISVAVILLARRQWRQRNSTCPKRIVIKRRRWRRYSTR